jgi:hypothetical protein
VLVLLLYFLVGFFLLAQSEFFSLRARWYLQRIPASGRIGINWAVYSLILLVIIAVAVAFLPTGYSGPLFQTLQRAVGFVLAIATYLVMLAMLPLLMLVQWLMSSMAPRTLSDQPAQPPVVPPPAPFEPDVILQVLRSLLFWTIFVFGVYFAFRYYFGQRRDWIEQLKRRPGLGWLGRLLEWLARRWRRLERRVEAASEEAAGRLRAAARARHLRLPGILAVGRRLPARAQILLLYASMLRWNEQNGIHRPRAQTPIEYGRALAERLPACRSEIDAITAGFMEARYTRHEIRPEEAERVREAWSRLKRATILWLDTGREGMDGA